MIDEALPGTLSFSRATYTVGEDAGVAAITVRRHGGTNGVVTVNYATEINEGDAVSGQDYTPITGTLTFVDGQASAIFNVFIQNDEDVEFPEMIKLKLDEPDGGAELGTITDAILTIIDDDTANPGVLQFNLPSYQVAEEDQLATISVNRTGGYDGVVSVAYSTTTGTAIGGIDYVAVSNTLHFQDGMERLDFTVPIVSDQLSEGNEIVQLELGNPTGGVALGVPSSATLTIIDGKGSFSYMPFLVR